MIIIDVIDEDLSEFAAMVVYGFFLIIILQVISLLFKEQTEETSILVSILRYLV